MINIPKTAMIFAAGRGTRMKPLTDKIPKPMALVCGKALIDYRLDKIVEIGVSRAVINTHHKSEILEQHLKKRTDIEIIISREKFLLDTGGGLVKALPLLGNEPFYMINSDVIWIDKAKEQPALIQLAEEWCKKRMDELLLIVEKQHTIGYKGNGDFSLGENNILKRNEKNNFVFSGIEIFNPRAIEKYEEKAFSRSVLWKNAMQPDYSFNRMYGSIMNGQWLHVDSIDGIKSAEKFLKQNSGDDSNFYTYDVTPAMT